MAIFCQFCETPILVFVLVFPTCPSLPSSEPFNFAATIATVAGEAAAAAAMVVYWTDGRTFRHPQLPMCSPLDFLVGLAAACFSLLVVAVILCCQSFAVILSPKRNKKSFCWMLIFPDIFSCCLFMKIYFLFQYYAYFEKGVLEQKN